jgi:3-oxoacyl-[acyl-carrier protein] reductase
MSDSPRELEGRVALVTGASRNIGRCIVRVLADAGATVIVNGRTSMEAAQSVVAEVEAGGGKAFAYLADVADERIVDAMFAEVRKRYGRLDILVNNAAVRDVTKLDEIDLATWRYVTGVILDGAFICTKAALPLLRASDAGAIINIGGMSGHTGSAGRPHVVAAKLGLVGLTRALAHDLGPDGITVNCVVPGYIDTKRNASSGPARTEGHHGVLGHRGKPEDVAHMVRYLAGPHGRYLTGQEWHVNGGGYMG